MGSSPTQLGTPLLSDGSEKGHDTAAVSGEPSPPPPDLRTSLQVLIANVAGAAREMASLLWSGLRERSFLFVSCVIWTAVVVPMALFVGTVCAFFLWVLNYLTEMRLDHAWILFLLPVAGSSVALLYHIVGRETSRGNNLILDEIHTPRSSVKGRASIPSRMAPLILVATWVSQLFGASVGREGTAIQVAVSVTSTYAMLLRRLGLKMAAADLRILFIAGIGAGFGGVFGTPAAAAVFSMEVLTVGIIYLDPVVPSLIAAFVADWTCRQWFDILRQSPDTYNSTCLRAVCGIHVVGDVNISIEICMAAILVGILSGLASVLFCIGCHYGSRFFQWSIRNAVLRPFVGGLLIIAMRYAFGTVDYLGIGTYERKIHYPGVSIESAFGEGGARPYSWFAKLLFTCMSISTGFKGGELTPLFFIGACLGNLVAGLLSVPAAQFNLYVALAYVSIFAGATNTPIAAMVLGVELFGGQHVLYLMLACTFAYIAAGSSSVYQAQRLLYHDKLDFLTWTKARGTG